MPLSLCMHLHGSSKLRKKVDLPALRMPCAISRLQMSQIRPTTLKSSGWLCCFREPPWLASRALRVLSPSGRLSRYRLGSHTVCCAGTGSESSISFLADEASCRFRSRSALRAWGALRAGTGLDGHKGPSGPSRRAPALLEQKQSEAGSARKEIEVRLACPSWLRMSDSTARWRAVISLVVSLLQIRGVLRVRAGANSSMCR